MLNVCNLGITWNLCCQSVCQILEWWCFTRPKLKDASRSTFLLKGACKGIMVLAELIVLFVFDGHRTYNSITTHLPQWVGRGRKSATYEACDFPKTLAIFFVHISSLFFILFLCSILVWRKRCDLPLFLYFNLFKKKIALS